MTQVKCSFCGFSFAPEEGRAACAGCPLKRLCRRIKCPNCGFELAVSPCRLRKEGTGDVRQAK
ncbi:MAG: hypothetical protein PWP43_1093 [Bacillota bacterium]|nr:hypothetical protein [Bacillota bacterium]